MPVASPRASPAPEREKTCVLGAPGELQVKRVLTVFTADGVFYTLVKLTVSNNGARVIENVRVSDEIPAAFLPNVKFIDAPASLDGGTALWNAGTLAPGESKTFAYLLRGRVPLSEFKTPAAESGRAAGLTPQFIALLVALAVLAALVLFILKKRKR